jgi:hypothetical protein
LVSIDKPPTLETYANNNKTKAQKLLSTIARDRTNIKGTIIRGLVVVTLACSLLKEREETKS